MLFEPFKYKKKREKNPVGFRRRRTQESLLLYFVGHGVARPTWPPLVQDTIQHLMGDCCVCLMVDVGQQRRRRQFQLLPSTVV